MSWEQKGFFTGFWWHFSYWSHIFLQIEDPGSQNNADPTNIDRIKNFTKFIISGACILSWVFVIWKISTVFISQVFIAVECVNFFGKVCDYLWSSGELYTENSSGRTESWNIYQQIYEKGTCFSNINYNYSSDLIWFDLIWFDLIWFEYL